MKSSWVPNGSPCPDILAAREPCDLLQLLLRIVLLLPQLTILPPLLLIIRILILVDLNQH